MPDVLLYHSLSFETVSLIEVTHSARLLGSSANFQVYLSLPWNTEVLILVIPDFYEGARDLNSGPHAYIASTFSHWAILLALITGTFDEATRKGDFSGLSGFWAKEKKKFLALICPPSILLINTNEKKKWEGEGDITKDNSREKWQKEEIDTTQKR